jgi:hypothetical protein
MYAFRMFVCPYVRILSDDDDDGESVKHDGKLFSLLLPFFTLLRVTPLGTQSYFSLQKAPTHNIMMLPAIQRLSLYIFLLFMIGPSDAFHHSSSRWTSILSPTVGSPSENHFLAIGILQQPWKPEAKASPTALNVVNGNDKKKKESAASGPQEKEKVGGMGLFLLYMTPWKNPNSIFVYMLVTLYALGKYSEAHSAASSIGP